MPFSVSDMPAAWGESLFTAQLKTLPEDFLVNEVLDIQPDGQGEHLFLHVEKTGMNTDELSDLLERAYQVDSKAVGYAGMKDRHAVTSQWFSITTPETVESLNAILSETNADHKHARVLQSERHSRKLRHGAHSGNEFTITLKQVQAQGEHSVEDLQKHVEDRIASINSFGFPNYIGPQRFGFGGQNLVRARQWFRQPKKRASRQQRSLWLSSSRSAIFNAVCARRVDQGTWQQLLPGEPAMLEGSRSFFDTTSSTPEELQTRLDAFDIHPSAPWWGRGTNPSTGECEAFEANILEEFKDICGGLERAGLAQERRGIRAQAHNLSHRWLDETTLELSFLLSPGLFATTLLGQLGVCHEPDRRQST